ncbi:MAG: hypothetical protein N2314_03200 [Brevinematales bacterium]|nr:hypothetical protein [Brevinematales bacterium]
MFFLQSFWGLWYITFLPGFIFLRLARWRACFLFELVGSMGLSLLFNYGLLFLATLLRLPLRGTVWAMSLVFLLLLIWLLVRENPRHRQQSFVVILFSLGMLFFLWFLNQFVAKSGSIPWAGDDLLGWNTWALAWYEGKGIFTQQNFYPQMLPITWATSYLFSGTSEIFFFSRSLMPYFFFGIFLTGLALWWTERKTLTLFGLISLGWLFVLWRHFPRMTMGLADIPAAFFGFASFGFFLLFRRTRDYVPLWISLLLATASALTKQYGILYWMGLWILVLFEGVKNTQLWQKKVFWLVAGLCLLFIGAWYGYGFFAQGYHHSLVSLISSGPFEAYASHPLVNKESSSLLSSLGNTLIKSTLFLMEQFRHPLFFVAMLLFTGISLWIRPYGGVFLVITLPAFLFWSELIAYDIRNFSVGLVFFVYQAGIGLGWVIEKILTAFPLLDKGWKHFLSFLEKSENYGKHILPHCLIFLWITLSTLLISGSLFFSQSYLMNQQNQRMKIYVGNHREVNAMLYAYLSIHPETVIYTDYPFIRYMPEVRYILSAFTNLSQIETALSSHEKVAFLIITTNGFPPSKFSPEVESFFQSSKTLVKKADVGTGLLIEKR